MSYTTLTTPVPSLPLSSNLHSVVRGMASPFQNADEIGTPQPDSGKAIPGLKSKEPVFLWLPQDPAAQKYRDDHKKISFICYATLDVKKCCRGPHDNIWIELRHFGPSHTKTALVIVVYCPSSIRKKVQEALSTNEIRRHIIRARLQLIYFPYEAGFQHWLAAYDSDEDPQDDTPYALCGQTVSYQDREATIGLTLAMERANQTTFYALTVDHLFRSPENLTDDMSVSSSDATNTVSDSASSLNESWPETTPLWVLDIEYEEEDEDDHCPADGPSEVHSAPSASKDQSQALGMSNTALRSSFRPPSPDVSELSSTASELAELDEIEPIEGGLAASPRLNISEPPNQAWQRSPPDQPYLDWALIDLESQCWTPTWNAIIPPGALKPANLIEIDAFEPTSPCQVWVISSRVGPVAGTLYPSQAYLGGGQGRRPALAYTIDFSDNHGVSVGSSGSIVIRQADYAVLGHIVAANPLGEAYYAAYSSVKQQIANSAGISPDRVRLPTLQDIADLLALRSHGGHVAELSPSVKSEMADDKDYLKGLVKNFKRELETHEDADVDMKRIKTEEDSVIDLDEPYLSKSKTTICERSVIKSETKEETTGMSSGDLESIDDDHKTMLLVHNEVIQHPIFADDPDILRTTKVNSMERSIARYADFRNSILIPPEDHAALSRVSNPQYAECARTTPTEGTLVHSQSGATSINHEELAPPRIWTLPPLGPFVSMPVSPKITAEFIEEWNTLVVNVEVNGIRVARRLDHNFINATKLLEAESTSIYSSPYVTSRCETILNSEFVKDIVRAGPGHLLGVWIPLKQAQNLATEAGSTQQLFPLFEYDIEAYVRDRAGAAPDVEDKAALPVQARISTIQTSATTNKSPLAVAHHNTDQSEVVHISGRDIADGRSSLFPYKESDGFGLDQRLPVNYAWCRLCPGKLIRVDNPVNHVQYRHSSLVYFKQIATEVGLRFTCGGTLADGTQWGCGCNFASWSDVAYHLATEQGRVCIEPLFFRSDAFQGHAINGPNELDPASLAEWLDRERLYSDKEAGLDREESLPKLPANITSGHGQLLDIQHQPAQDTVDSARSSHDMAIPPQTARPWAATYQQESSPNAQVQAEQMARGVRNASTYLGEMESDFWNNTRCCDTTFNGLHEFLSHFGDVHAPGPARPAGEYDGGVHDLHGSYGPPSRGLFTKGGRTASWGRSGRLGRLTTRR